MKMINSKRKYKGLGFIEVLIAIVVVGVVSSVFITLSGKAMKDLIQNERVEYMSRLAKDGVNVAQEIANREKANIVTTPDTNYFPDAEDYCYITMREGEGENVEYKFLKEGTAFKDFRYLDSDVRSQIVDWIVYNSEPGYLAGQQYFVVVCIESIEEDIGWAHIQVWVGDTDLKGEMTSDSDVKDFKFYAVVDL
jgi:type II secretory pathway pseudopilin PulG